ncbi:MAG TPA: T9SS type A sorting domain-containing protein, partial [Bacteroidia bacterium]|nr:T9SS type A sorting domain-containing protein [Bacteroidia bacterium]
GTTSVGTVDAPAAMMPNGKILVSVSPVNTSNNDQFRAPTWFLEYTYTTNTFAQVTSTLPGLNADSLAGIDCDFTTMLLLPNGSVLLGINQQTISNEYWIYTPTGSTITQGIPTIGTVAVDGYPTYKITGKLFNGISEGAGFGDDWQMSTNYPLVRLTNGTNTYYAKTTKWNRIGAVQTDSLADTALFTLPASLPAGTYSLTVVVNGFASNPTLFTPSAPLTVSISSETNILCNGNATGSATANASGGASPYTYLWSPGGGTLATKSGLSAGTYTINVTDKNANTATASVVITQPAPLRDSISTYSCSNRKTKATVGVKGGTSPYTYSWSPGGGTKATMSGLSNGTYTITVKDKNGCSVSTTKTFSCAIAPPPGNGEIDGDPDNLLSTEAVNIYPNPSKGQFTISGLENGMIVDIYDYTGRKISSMVSSETILQLDLSGQSNGIYLVRILSKDGTLVSQKKLVKAN